MKLSFIIARLGEQRGPLTSEEILRLLKNQELSWSDQLFDTETSSWVSIVEHPLFKTQFIRNFVPEQISRTEQEGQTLEPFEWYVLRSDRSFGPYTYLDLVRLLQESKLAASDLVWNSQLGQWRSLQECAEFSEAAMRALHSDPELSKIFFRRRFRRLAFETSLVVHNNKNVWKGKSIEIGAGGAGINLTSPDFQIGQTLFLHFKAGEKIPAFNALCAIVSKQLPKPGMLEIRYGVEFRSIIKSVQQAILASSGDQAA